MTNKFCCLFLLIPFLLLSCSYENNSILLFPDHDKPVVEDTHGLTIFSGNITDIAMNTIDRYNLNRIFERTASFQKAHWHSNKSNNDYLIILRPAYHNQLINHVCRTAELFKQGGSKTDKLFITGCRVKDGQWQLLSKFKKEKR